MQIQQLQPIAYSGSTNNHPMELVNAWGHATRGWHKHSARARGKDGKLFKFTFSGGVFTAVNIP